MDEISFSIGSILNIAEHLLVLSSIRIESSSLAFSALLVSSSPSESNSLSTKERRMFTRNVTIKLEPNSAPGFTRLYVVKRLFLLAIISIFMVFAGLQSAPITTANEACEMVCSAPYIDPSDGQCYVTCCPADDKCKSPCEQRRCTKRP